MNTYQDWEFKMKFPTPVLTSKFGYLIRDCLGEKPILIADIDCDQIYTYPTQNGHCGYTAEGLLILLSHLKADKKIISNLLDRFDPKITYRFAGLGWSNDGKEHNEA